MHPTIDLNFTEIPVYTALVALGILVGIAAAYFFLRQYSRRIYTLALVLDAALVTFIAGYIGARVYHLALNWDYYSSRPDAMCPIRPPAIGSATTQTCFLRR